MKLRRWTRLPFKRLSWLTILITLNVALLVFSSVAAWKIYGYEPPRPSLLDAFIPRPPPPQLIDYKDFISIMLSGLSLMITVLGIGLATIAIWGYGTIKDEAKQAAEKIATAEAKRIAIATSTVTARDVAQAVATRTIQPSDVDDANNADQMHRLLKALMDEDGAAGNTTAPPTHG